MNPAVLLPFLANPITNTTSNTPSPDIPHAIPGAASLNVSDLSPEGCFLPDPAKPQTPIIFADCATGIVKDQMSTYPDMDKFLIWSREETSTTDVVVPYVRYSGTCALVLNVKKQDVYERDSFGDVLHSAIILARQCVIIPPHRGGQVNLGSRGRLELTIVRRPGYLEGEGGWLQGIGNGSLATAGRNPEGSPVDVN